MLTLLASFAQEESRSISENVKWGTVKRFKQGIPNGHFNIYGYRWDGDHLVIQPDEARIVRLIFDNFLKGLSAEMTEKQLAEMGILSYKGLHFSNTSIRQILGNVTYTGNLLFQKEYTVDPISGKSKINRGDLPQYWVENTHEPIIPLATYRAVQDEIARRRALGARANPHINTGCFTAKSMRRCGMSYQRSSRVVAKTRTTPISSGRAEHASKRGRPSVTTKTSRKGCCTALVPTCWGWRNSTRRCSPIKSTTSLSQRPMRWCSIFMTDALSRITGNPQCMRKAGLPQRAQVSAYRVTGIQVWSTKHFHSFH